MPRFSDKYRTQVTIKCAKTSKIADEIKEETFLNNCSPIVISDGEVEESYPDMELVQITKMNDEYWFVLRDISAEERNRMNYENGISYLAEKTLSDADSMECMDIYPKWSPKAVSYKKGNRRRHGEKLYKCLQDHVSQADWAPDVAHSLWVRIDDPSVEWPEWIQPTGSTDAYPQGAKVTHNEKRWTSDLDNNVWEPGVSGWTEYTEE